ncbi:MAG: ATP-binding protein [Pseudomonadota bacterium]
MTDTAKITIHNKTPDIGRAMDFIDTYCRDHGIDDGTIAAVSIPVDELLHYAIRHGYPDARTGKIQIRLRLKDTRVKVRIIDDAEAFNPASPTFGCPALDPHNASFGLRLVKLFAEGLTYERRDDHNITKFTARVSRAGSREA